MATENPMQAEHHMRFHAPHAHLAAPFGSDSFGLMAERTARFFGTPVYLITQTLMVIAWIVVNAAVVALQCDPYPFILLNLAFSTQAAYAAPLILLAQTRQAERDKVWADADLRHREELFHTMLELLEQNTNLTKEIRELSGQVETLTEQIHQKVVEV